MDGENVDEMNPNPLSRKLKFSGICKLTDEELSHLYKLDELTDEELVSLGLERGSLIDDYRLLHEVSMMRKLENEAAKPPNPPEPPMLASLSEWELHEQLQHMDYIPKKVYKFELLNKLVKVMSIEKESGTIFSEEQLRLDLNYIELNSYLVAPQERLGLRLESFYNYLDNMFVSGDRNKALELVLHGIRRLNRRHNSQDNLQECLYF
ncbi:GM12322 [Drosophila sechellia]|uniref:GM12322 n=1 Tax=Drosophila sechellia TaxID=7238 RepID=B4I128_DROSE|nr:GM12322 [Drosophila sechellia]